MKRWSVLAVLAAAQFLMVLDRAVMNVSISQLGRAFAVGLVIYAAGSALTAESSIVPSLVEVRVAAGASFVESAQVEAAAEEAGVSPATTAELVSVYEDAQIAALKTAFLAAALLVLASFLATRALPGKRFG